MIQWGSSSKERARALWTICARDLLFYVNTFCYLHEPRGSGHISKVLPFITYPFQDDALVRLADALGDHNELIHKTRCMGATWMCLVAIEWQWHFNDYESFLLVSRKEHLVDKTGSTDSLMYKIDFLHKHQPGWLRPLIKRNLLHIGNRDNNSVIDGTSTTGDIGKGGRRGAVFIDEFAAFDRVAGYDAIGSVVTVSNCIIWNSTPGGVGNAYHEKHSNPAIPQIHMFWPVHPVYRRGLYTSKHGEVIKLDPDYKYPDDYEFVLDDKQRSPWYDRTAAEIGIPSLIAQELDGDFLGSGANFFDAALLRKLRDKDSDACTVLAPYHVGELDYITETGEPKEFLDRKNGRMLLWTHPDAKGRLPEDRIYTVGCDVSAGTGASNSCLSVFDTKAGEKVAEVATPLMRPEDFAVLAVAVAKWFKGEDDVGAILIWEAPGPGSQFGARILEMGYGNIFFQQQELRLSRKVTDRPGWQPTKGSKKVLLGDYGRALGSGTYINRSNRSFDDCSQYIFDGGDIIHTKSKTSTDPSGARENHGDMVIADALSWRARHMCYNREREEKPIPPHSYAARMAKWRREQKEERYPW